MEDDEKPSTNALAFLFMWALAAAGGYLLGRADSLWWLGATLLVIAAMAAVGGCLTMDDTSRRLYRERRRRMVSGR